MYFSLIPNIKYDAKPISYPFSESDFVLANNFFRRYQINEDLYGYATYYNKYSVQEGQSIETIANGIYGSPFYDWVIILTNNYINPLFSFPVDNWTLRKITEEKYGDDAYTGIHHYETIEKKTGTTIDTKPILALEGGLTVDKKFYDSNFTYYNGSTSVTVPGNTVSKPITNYEYEEAENEKRRSIYILKPAYFNRFVEDFKKGNLYQDSSDFINKRLKKTGV